ncbi:hypothetical protein [Saccharicrinis aurantiacus]|uniref:hypothetical protein n=1 Tax=Saccharicrinis aurantiacus TaxID=1849719 RepID=UPI002490040F|nr:hypothetical protein [Saccharicrinis aurantiacus]
MGSSEVNELERSITAVMQGPLSAQVSQFFIFEEKLLGGSEFDNLRRFVIDAFEALALVSENNFNLLIDSLVNFIDENKNKFKDVEFLYMSIEHIRKKFYETVVVSYDMASAKKKIDKFIFD